MFNNPHPSAVQVANCNINEGLFSLPIRGLSDVGGIVSATMFRKNVNERRTVTSVGKTKKKYWQWNQSTSLRTEISEALWHTRKQTTGQKSLHWTSNVLALRLRLTRWQCAGKTSCNTERKLSSWSTNAEWRISWAASTNVTWNWQFRSWVNRWH